MWLCSSKYWVPSISTSDLVSADTGDIWSIGKQLLIYGHFLQEGAATFPSSVKTLMECIWQARDTELS